jgi:transcriptional regulator with XRE-family HTH domain
MKCCITSAPAQLPQLRINAKQGNFRQIALLIEITDHLGPLLVVNFPQMNFSQMHERLRLELLRRIQRGTVSVSLLARQTGFGQSHLSNFLHNKRQLSLEAMDRILAALHMAADDLILAGKSFERAPVEEEFGSVPLVSHNSALYERVIRPAAVLAKLDLPSPALRSMRVRASNVRRTWQRFVAVRVTPNDAIPMDPLILPGALAVIDRHYTSFAQYHPDRATLYAVRNGGRLSVRYVEFLANRLVLRPLNIDFPVELIEIEPGGSPNDLIAGRVALVLKET